MVTFALGLASACPCPAPPRPPTARARADRAALGSGGLIYNNVDISALIAAVGSGLPGEYALRLEGEGPFEIPVLDIHPFQEVRIICTNVGSLKFNPPVAIAAVAPTAAPVPA